MRPVLPACLLLAACQAADPRAEGVVEDPDTGLPAPEPCTLVHDALPAEEGAFLSQSGAVAGFRDRCSGILHATAGARDSVVRVTLRVWGGGTPARVHAHDLLGASLSEPVLLGAGGSAEIALVQSGELFVAVEPADPDAAGNAYALDVDCVSGCDLGYTRYPLVLVHGAAPSDYVDLLTYFFDVAPTLDEAGYLVLSPVLDPWTSPEERAWQLQAQLEGYVASGAARRFNLIGHSQGGLEARYVASILDHDARIASVVTFATPHYGAPIADVSAGIVTDLPFAEDVVDRAADALAFLLGYGDQDMLATLDSLTTEGAAAFNETVPDAPGVYYASWAGRSCGLVDLVCAADNDGEVVAPYLEPTFEITKALSGDNDGLVPVSSAAWGEFQGVVPADHMDQVGQIAGLDEGDFDHRAFFVEEARRLGRLGF